MSGFTQPQWSGFSGPDAAEAEAAGHKAGHEQERIALEQSAGHPAQASTQDAPPEVAGEAAQPAPVTPSSPRPHKALTP
jgi:hypothetical protein